MSMESSRTAPDILGLTPVVYLTSLGLVDTGGKIVPRIYGGF